MKIAPANCVDVSKLGFVPEMDVFGILDYISGKRTSLVKSYKHYCHLLIMVKSLVAQTPRVLSSNHIPNVVALSAFSASKIK